MESLATGEPHFMMSQVLAVGMNIPKFYTDYKQLRIL